MKAKGLSFPLWNHVVVEKNLYSQDSNDVPWMLFSDDDPWQEISTKIDVVSGKINVEKNLYVVTNLVKIGDKKTVRSVGSWKWDGSTGQKKILDGEGQVIGFKKTLNLRGKGMEIMGNWIMHEYHLSGVSLQEVGGKNDCVVCRIKWDYSTSIDNNSSEVQESDIVLGKRKEISDQQEVLPSGKRVCSNGSSGIDDDRNIVTMAERSIISEIGTDVVGSNSINNFVVDGRIANTTSTGELDVMTQQMADQDDNLYRDLHDIVDLGDLSNFQGLF
ncbi:hypothetical protein ACH5RR_025483 [Cinchona calisaya]|uniref:NAC domain-containing protein n=1 Tax=Cinchona calisaya TaxID=153742 RepID=A0ABD2YZS7_9GENT